MLNRTRTLIACAAAASALGLAAGITAPALASSSAPGSPATTALARVYTQFSSQKAIPVPGGPNQFTPVDSSPVLPVGHYTYTVVVDIDHVAPGSEVLCGQQLRPTGGVNSGDYGIVDNTAGSVEISGHCVLSGVATVTQPNTTMSFWTTVYLGNTGAQVSGWSMTETKVGTVTFSS